LSLAVTANDDLVGIAVPEDVVDTPDVEDEDEEDEEEGLFPLGLLITGGSEYPPPDPRNPNREGAAGTTAEGLGVTPVKQGRVDSIHTFRASTPKNT
jgi:hypothetical protein